jgi:hypothetical protein
MGVTPSLGVDSIRASGSRTTLDVAEGVAFVEVTAQTRGGLGRSRGGETRDGSTGVQTGQRRSDTTARR